MVERKAPGPSWNDAELQSARRERRVICRLSHVCKSKKRHGFRSSKTSLLTPILIISPPVYSHTAFLDDFFLRSFPYTPVNRFSPKDVIKIIREGIARGGKHMSSYVLGFQDIDKTKIMVVG